jgi:hypothetical protein
MDERAMDPDQFDDASVYSVAETLIEAQEDQRESGMGVIIKVRLLGNSSIAEWVELMVAPLRAGE